MVRLLTPRNAIAALNELHGQSVNESVVIPTQGNKFEAEITINNVRYVGVGNSKMQAKNAASEKALRDLVINKFRQMKSQEAVATPLVSENNEDVNMEEEKDDVPMLQLASFALHKLFAEWESEGFEIPLPKSNVSYYLKIKFNIFDRFSFCSPSKPVHQPLELELLLQILN